MATPKSRRAFILLEVMVAIVIMAVAMVALIRGFIVSLDSLQRIRHNEVAILLAESLMDDLILEPPAEGTTEGEFSDDSRFGEDFEGWSWELEVEAEEPNYEERPGGRLGQELEQIYFANIKIYYENPNFDRRQRDRTLYVEIDTILLEPDVFSIDSLQANQIF